MGAASLYMQNCVGILGSVQRLTDEFAYPMHIVRWLTDARILTMRTQHCCLLYQHWVHGLDYTMSLGKIRLISLLHGQ